jgi:hypothetical protein
MKPTALLLANALVTGAAILVYHVATSKDAPPAAPSSDGPGLAAEGGPPGGAPDGAAPPILAPNYARFEALERRVASLERVAANASALAPTLPGAAPTAKGGGTPAPGAPPVWTEDQLVAFRAMLGEVELRKSQENYAAQMREVIRRSSKTPPDDDRVERAVALLAAFQRKVREIFPNASAGDTPEQRQASMETAQKARQALDEELRRVLPPEAAERVMALVQSFPGGFASDPPRAPPMGR